MRAKFIRDLSASSAQVIVNLVLGITIFVITSRYLDKAVYGELNWSLAVLTFITTLLSLRLEQLIVKKVAAGADASVMLAVFVGHILFAGLLLYLVLWIGSLLFPAFFERHALLLSIAIAQLFGFFSLPYKQVVTGKERFAWLAVLSSIANLVRATALCVAVINGRLTVDTVIAVFIISSCIEWLACIIATHGLLGLRWRRWPLNDYRKMLRESLPQIGVVVLNACIARTDWILLGLFSTQIATAEYSFAYRVFELSPVPLLVLGPVLLTRFSSWAANKSNYGLLHRRKEIGALVRVEMILATLLPMLLCIAWSPVMDMLTHGKYGKTNETVFLLLSCCIPFQYLVNVCWTAHFAQGNLKGIFRIALVTCGLVVVGDALLIPWLNATGAAIAYLVAIVVEYALYAVSSPFLSSRDKWLPLLTCCCIATVAGLLSTSIALAWPMQSVVACMIYILLLTGVGYVRRDDLRQIRQRISWNKIQYGAA